MKSARDEKQKPKTSAIPRISKTRGLTEQKKQSGFKSIVVPIDFSETSIKALDYAPALAGEFGSQIHFVHVLEFSLVFNSTSKLSYATWDKEAKKSAMTRHAELVGEKVDEWIWANWEVRSGRAYKAICETAREHKADLIIIGTHGFTGLKHLLLGSTAERVIRHAPCSVLTVRTQHLRNASSVVKPKKVLVPTDFSKPADAAFQFAVALAKRYQTQIHLLHVVPAHHPAGEYLPIDYGLLEAEEMEAGRKALGALSRTLLAKNLFVKTDLRRGRPATEITTAAEKLGSDLIAISTHGLTGWQHALLGSTTEEVVRLSLCPVLVIRKQ
jgi:nucleotide-binding universal stress UspA family protein